MRWQRRFIGLLVRHVNEKQEGGLLDVRHVREPVVPATWAEVQTLTMTTRWVAVLMAFALSDRALCGQPFTVGSTKTRQASTNFRAADFLFPLDCGI